MATFIIKNNQTYYIYLSKIEGCYETDIDHDGENELVCYANWGSGISHDCYYLLDKHDDAIYWAYFQCTGYFKWIRPDRVNADGDLIVTMRTNDEQTVEGLLSLRKEAGQNILYVDAGEYGEIGSDSPQPQAVGQPLDTP